MTHDRAPRRWAPIALAVGGVLVVAIITGVLFGTGILGRPTAADPSPTPTDAPAPSSAPPSASESPAPSDEPSGLAYEPPPGVLPPGARVIVNQPIELRIAAMDDAEVTAEVDAGREMRVNGPLIVDGERWYTLASTDPNDPVYGYVALDPSGDAVGLAPISCPDGEPSVASLAPLDPWERLACNGDHEIVLEGHEVVGFGGFRPGVYAPDWLNGFLGAFAIADPDDASRYLFVRVAPDGPDVTRPQAGAEVGSATLRVTGHFNDPAATTCSVTDLPIGPEVTDRTADLEPIAAELACRAEFVVTGFEVVDEGEAEVPTLSELDIDSLVASVADGVTLREEPGVDGRRIGTLPIGAESIVLEGPVEADGFAWYRLSGTGLPPYSGCVTGPVEADLHCPTWHGWAAAGNPDDGSAWFVPVDADCPDPSTDVNAFLLIPHRMPIVCYGSDDISFTAFYPELPDDAGLGGQCDADASIAWLYCAHLSDEEVWSTDVFTGAAKLLFVDPDGGVELPERGQWLRITGHFDDAAAAGCADAESDAGVYGDADLAVLSCRTGLVVTAVEVTSGP